MVQQAYVVSVSEMWLVVYSLMLGISVALWSMSPDLNDMIHAAATNQTVSGAASVPPLLLASSLEGCGPATDLS